MTVSMPCTPRPAAPPSAAIGGMGDRRAWLLSGFAYRNFHDLMQSRAVRKGVEVITVNPAYTSVIGMVKFDRLSRHAAAAMAIARRAYDYQRS